MTDAAAELAQRIERFEHMAQADSDNEMAHFSLGNAYVQASRHAEAAKSFEECIRINPEMSKAWQLCGQSMIAAGWEDKAVEILEKGHEVAASKGDLMPRKAIEEALLSIGRPVPELSKDADEAAERERRLAHDAREALGGTVDVELGLQGALIIVRGARRDTGRMPAR